MKEFSCVWFGSSQRWIVLFPNGQIIDREFVAYDDAVRSAYEELQILSEWECTEDTGTFSHYQEYEVVVP